MKDITFSLSLQTVPPVARRGQHALIFVQNTAGKFLLGGKKHYPAGIVRLLGGGMEAGEEALPAAQRELEEEIGVKVPLEQLQPIATITHTIQEAGKPEPLTFTTHLFFTRLSSAQSQYQAADDVDEIVELTEAELATLIQHFAQLPKEVSPANGFAWFDYGQIYGPIHQLALDFVRSQETS